MHASTGKPDPLPNIDETGSLRQHFKCRGTEWLTASVGIGVFTRKNLMPFRRIFAPRRS